MEELQRSQQYLARRIEFSSPSPTSNPKLQQGCQGVHSLRPSLGKLESCSPGPPSVISGVTQRAHGHLLGACISAWSRPPKLGPRDAAGLWKLRGGFRVGQAAPGAASPISSPQARPNSRRFRRPPLGRRLLRAAGEGERDHPPVGGVPLRAGSPAPHAGEQFPPTTTLLPRCPRAACPPGGRLWSAAPPPRGDGRCRGGEGRCGERRPGAGLARGATGAGGGKAVGGVARASPEPAPSVSS